MVAKFSIKATASPRDVGLWLQAIMLANPDRLFMMKAIQGDIICAPVVGEDDAVKAS
tara:strand:+ start:35151 stop:35321 length:171 start_codon:yes stop_codon:yes gene_type:complete